MPVKMTAFSLAHQQPPQILKTAMISPESNSFSAAEADPFKVVSAKLVPMVLPAGSESSISISAESSDSDLPSRVAAKKKHGIKNDKPEKNENAKNSGSGLATSSQFALNETSLQSQTPLAAGSPVPPPAAASASAITNENANSNSNAVAYKQPPPFVPPDTPSPRLTAKKPTDLKVETAGNNNNLKLPPAVNVQEISPTAQVIKLTSDSNNDPHGAYMMPNRAEFISKYKNLLSELIF
jgi:hypothetical protein